MPRASAQKAQGGDSHAGGTMRFSTTAPPTDGTLSHEHLDNRGKKTDVDIITVSTWAGRGHNPSNGMPGAVPWVVLSSPINWCPHGVQELQPPRQPPGPQLSQGALCPCPWQPAGACCSLDAQASGGLQGAAKPCVPPMPCLPPWCSFPCFLPQFEGRVQLSCPVAPLLA